MSLVVSCSPKMFQRVQTDDQYRLQVTYEVLSEHKNEVYNEVQFMEAKSSETEVSELINEIPSGSSTLSVGGNDNWKCITWQDAATKLMLSLVEELRPKIGKSLQCKTKGKMYEVVAAQMSSQGYNFTPVQIENKFRGLERVYKKTVLHNRKTGSNRQTCCYESELSRILGDQKGINPEFILDSGDSEGISYSQTSTDDTEGETDRSLNDEVPNRKTKSGVRQQVLEKIDVMVEENKEFHTKVLNMMEKKEKAKEERAQKKMKLLEALLEKLK